MFIEDVWDRGATSLGKESSFHLFRIRKDYISFLRYPIRVTAETRAFLLKQQLLFQKTSHKSIQQSRARWNLTITSSLERLKRLFTTLTLRFFYIFSFFDIPTMQKGPSSEKGRGTVVPPLLAVKAHSTCRAIIA